MTPSITRRLHHVLERLQLLSAQLADPGVIRDQEKFRDLSREYVQIEPLGQCFRQYQEVESHIASARGMLDERDPELRALAEEEMHQGLAQQEALERKIQQLLLPSDPNDSRNLFLEIRAGTGGDEAALFAGDLYRMYARYAEERGWAVEVVAASPGEHGGFKELILRVVGQGAYARLKFESGTHRVQRVPETEAQGRIHTSACTVAVLAEVPEVEHVEISPTDLKVDTYRSSGAGGQHVNKTDSAVRITHLPTGIVVECQDERSQHKNRARAMALLQAKLLAGERERQEAEQAQTRKSMVGSGDRSERIRTYNFPQGRVTDHRINLTLYKLEDVLEGHLDQLIDPLQSEHQAAQLAAMAG
jgi:peptide chain release factor 1